MIDRGAGPTGDHAVGWSPGRSLGRWPCTTGRRCPEHADRQAHGALGTIQACRKGGPCRFPGLRRVIYKVNICARFVKGLTLRWGQTTCTRYLEPLLERSGGGDLTRHPHLARWAGRRPGGLPGLKEKNHD